MQSSYTGRVSEATRNAVLDRDGFRCFYCGILLCRFAPKEHLATMDHVLPRSRGGAGDASNLNAACAPCNTRKGAKTLEEYRDYLMRSASGYDEALGARYSELMLVYDDYNTPLTAALMAELSWLGKRLPQIIFAGEI